MPKAPARKRYCTSKETFNDDARYLSLNLVSPMSHFFASLTPNTPSTDNKHVQTSTTSLTNITLIESNDKNQEERTMNTVDNPNSTHPDNNTLQESGGNVLSNTQTLNQISPKRNLRAKIEKFLAQESSDWQALHYGLFLDLGSRLITIGPCLIVDEWWYPALHDTKCTASCTEIPNLPLVRCRASQIRVLLNFDYSLLDDHGATRKEEESLREKTSALRRIYGGTATDYFYKTNFVRGKGADSHQSLAIDQCMYNNLWVQFVPSGWIDDYPLEDQEGGMSNLITGKLYATRVFRVVRGDGVPSSLDRTS